MSHRANFGINRNMSGKCMSFQVSGQKGTTGLVGGTDYLEQETNVPGKMQRDLLKLFFPNKTVVACV